MDFSPEVISYTILISGATTENIELGSSGYDIHVLAVAMQQEKDLSETILYCGSDLIAKNYAKDLPQIFFSYHCIGEDFYIEKTGQDEAYINILYATTSQQEYMHNVEVENQLFGAEMLLIAGIIIFILSFKNWRYIFRLTTR